MAQVTVSPYVQHQLNELLEQLVLKNYFSFLENAEAYEDALIDFMYTIPNQRKRQTDSNEFGQWYCSFHPNKNTQWFFVFDIVGDTYHVKKIFNNHTKDCSELNRISNDGYSSKILTPRTLICA